MLNDTGTLLLADATPEGYRESGRCRVLGGGHCWTPPSLANGRLFVRDGEQAVCIRVGEPGKLRPGASRPAAAVATMRIDCFRLLGREPEYPNDAPTIPELKRWFLVCVGGVFLPAVVLAALAAAIARPGWHCILARCTFWLTTFALGIAATPVLSIASEAFVCTWPASLYAALAVTLRSAVNAERQPTSPRARWQARGVTLLFLAVVLGYYLLCKAVGLMTLWAFLPGFIPALLFAVPAAKFRRAPLAIACDACGFTVYFWVSGLGIGWRTIIG